MVPCSPIKALFLDIGGVLLTNGWDDHIQKRAADKFGLDYDEMNGRHHLTFDIYEEGKLSQDEYSNRVVFLPRVAVLTGGVQGVHVRPVPALPRDDRADVRTQKSTWSSDGSCK